MLNLVFLEQFVKELLEATARWVCCHWPVDLTAAEDVGGGSPGRQTRGCTVERPAHGTPVSGASSSEKRWGPQRAVKSTEMEPDKGAKLR